LRLGALNGKPVQIDRCVFAEFDERQPEIRVVVQIVLRHLVKDRRPTEVVAAFEEAPDQIADDVGGSNRISERRSCPPFHAMHHEAGAVVVEQQRLVPQVHQAGHRRGPVRK
jgi:hypothetical protein